MISLYKFEDFKSVVRCSVQVLIVNAIKELCPFSFRVMSLICRVMSLFFRVMLFFCNSFYFYFSLWEWYTDTFTGIRPFNILSVILFYVCETKQCFMRRKVKWVLCVNFEVFLFLNFIILIFFSFCIFVISMIGKCVFAKLFILYKMVFDNYMYLHVNNVQNIYMWLRINLIH